MLARATLVLVLGAAGCDRVFALELPTDAPGIDAQQCFGTGALALCLAEAAAAELQVAVGASTTIDTDVADCASYTGADPELCVIAARTIQIDGVLLGKGSRPLVLIATTTATIGGKIDVASNIFVRAAGSDLADCVAGTASSGGGGGGGGSFGGRGGDGGGGNTSTTNGGIASPVVPPIRLRGGCAGRGASVVAVGRSRSSRARRSRSTA